MSDNLIKGQVVVCTATLAAAIQEAGGTFTPDILDMTLREFIISIAGQNCIRFTFTKPDD